MFNTLQEDINQMSDEELMAISLKETLSLEEMICDTVFEEAVAVTNLTHSGTPRNQNLDDTVNSLMFHNQDHLGMSEEDATNFDPDHSNLDLDRDALEAKDGSMDSGLVESLLDIKINEAHAEPDGDEGYSAGDDPDLEDGDEDKDDESLEESTSLVNSLIS